MSDTKTLPTPKELYKKFSHDPLECDCKTDKNHHVREELNGEDVVECTKCKRFLKFPKELPKAEKTKASTGGKK